MSESLWGFFSGGPGRGGEKGGDLLVQAEQPQRHPPPEPATSPPRGPRPAGLSPPLPQVLPLPLLEPGQKWGRRSGWACACCVQTTKESGCLKGDPSEWSLSRGWRTEDYP